MRIHQRHQRRKSIVRNSQNADLPIALRHILHQPVDRVISVGRMVDRRRIQRPVQRPVHHIVAFRSVLAAHVLHHADVSALHNHFDRVVIAVQNRSQMRTLRMTQQCAGVIRRPRQQDRRILRALGNHDHRMQLHPVAHRDHHIPLDVVEAGGHRLDFGWSFAGQRTWRATRSAPPQIPQRTNWQTERETTQIYERGEIILSNIIVPESWS